MITALAASGQTAFAASQSGLMRTLDGGRSWHSAFDALGAGSAIAVSAVALAPEFATVKTVFASAQGAILRSSDGGDTWQAAQLPTPAPFVTSLAISPDYGHDHTLFAASLEDGVFRSTDGGATWNSWNFGLLDFQVLSLVIAPNNTLYAGTATGLFASRNAGRAWSEFPLPCGHLPVLSLASTPEMLLAGTEGAGLLSSRDNGNTWQGGVEKALETVNALVVDGASTLALTPDTLFLSHDAGQTWQILPKTQDKTPVAICAAHKVFIGYENGEIEAIDTYALDGT